MGPFQNGNYLFHYLNGRFLIRAIVRDERVGVNFNRFRVIRNGRHPPSDNITLSFSVFLVKVFRNINGNIVLWSLNWSRKLRLLVGVPSDTLYQFQLRNNLHFIALRREPNIIYRFLQLQNFASRFLGDIVRVFFEGRGPLFVRRFLYLWGSFLAKK